jgi:hypothetical protein
MSGASLASVAIRSSLVEMLVELGVSVIVPSIDPCPGSPFPPRGPLGRFPRFIGYYELLGLLDALGSASFPSLGCTALAGGGVEASQVPGKPSRACPALRPRRDRHARPSGTLPYPSARDFAFRYFDAVGSRDTLVSRLNHTARTLVVYAS